MKNTNLKKQNCLSSKFEKRLFYLVNEFYKYLRTGNYHGVFPALLSCVVCCWCSKPVVKRVFNKEDIIVLHTSSLRSLNYELKNGLSYEKFFTDDLFDDFLNKCSDNENN